MKRLSLFAAVLFAAVMSFAQAPAITFSAVSATGTLKDSTFATTNLTVQTVDPDSKMQIDANTAVFKGNGIAEITCTHRLKTGGKTNEAVTKNYMKLMASEAGTLLIGVRTGSNSDATRKLVVSQNGAEIFNDFISEALKDSVVNDGGKAYFYHMVEVPVAAGQIILSYPVNGLNFYCFALLVAGETKTVATVEKLWSGEPMGWTTADTRQWAGFGDYVYWESKANHTIYGTHDGVNVDTIFTNAAIDGTAFCLDGAGNFIVEGIFPSTPSHLFLLKHDTTAYVDIPIIGLGRTDIITATGDVFSAEGGFVFVHGNGKNLFVRGGIKILQGPKACVQEQTGPDRCIGIFQLFHRDVRKGVNGLGKELFPAGCLCLLLKEAYSVGHLQERTVRFPEHRDHLVYPGKIRSVRFHTHYINLIPDK
jgi:hypothetical protein